ncbi:MFS transporter [Cohnella nanjingensis]|uniref:MFS transporter n=1 Tax=Cohnella nanjingensis TaxID=1387779 RepID=A0A7X0VH34_9BACL|nr:MFS transporter [Cohnella nanjingensis]MBB6673073.1 MFS transporter [Cohnella nanjingensis]
MYELLKDKTYLAYWLAVVIAMTGDAIARISVIYLLSRMTDNPLYIALVIFAQLLPSALLGIFLGPFTERYPKRTIMISADLSRMAILLVMIFFVDAPWILLTLVLLSGLARAVFEPARIASVPRIVGGHSLPAAIALFQSTVQTVNIVGPMLAGLLLVIDHPPLIFSISAAAYACSALLFNRIGVLREEQSQVRPNPGMSDTYLASLREGIRETMALASIRYLIFMMIPVMIILGLFTTNYNALLLQTFHAEALQFGMLEAAFAAGAIGGALIGPRLMKRRLRPGLLLQTSTALLGLSLLLVIPMSIWCETAGMFPVYVWCILAGLSQGLYQVPLSSSFMMKLPQRLLGRGASLFNALIHLCMVVGVLAGGWLAGLAGVAAVMGYAGALLLVVAVFARSAKGFRELQEELPERKEP